MKRWWIVMMCVLCMLQARAQNKGVERPITNETAKAVAGQFYYQDDVVSVKGKIFNYFIKVGYAYGEPSFVTFDLRDGWDWLIGEVGVSDDEQDVNGSLVFESQDETLGTVVFKSGQKSTLIRIPLTGRTSITIRRTKLGGLILEPRLVKGNPASLPPPTATTSPISSTVGAQAEPCPFTIDPKEIDNLAAELRKKVDAKPELKQRLEKEKIAPMTFMLVGLPYSDLAAGVADTFATSLLDADFHPVERGQLDVAVKEMKLAANAAFNTDQVIQLGKLAKCELIIVGSIQDQGQMVVINARILDTQTGDGLVGARIIPTKIIKNR